MYASIPVYDRPIEGPQTAADKFLKLDSWGRAGLLEAEFEKLFAKCVCGLVMTRRVFKDHDCAVSVTQPVTDVTFDDTNNSDTDVIDLTSEV